jgi:hypothetical protein
MANFHAVSPYTNQLVAELRTAATMIAHCVASLDARTNVLNASAAETLQARAEIRSRAAPLTPA